jgi:hypothetical protein
MLRDLSRVTLAAVLASALVAAPVLQAQQSKPAAAPAPAATASSPAAAAAASTNVPSDPWPRRVVSNAGIFLIYQPQLDSWKNNQLEAHTVVSVTPTGAKDPVFGVIWFSARTDVDKTNRLL